MYLLAFLQFWWLGRYRILAIRSLSQAGWTVRQLDDLLFYGVLGVIVGGRLGQVLFYEPGYYLAHPLQILAVWRGGMSFHGGLLGVLIAMWLYARKTGRHWLEITDFIAPLVPLGLAAGRIGNFINGELWGRPADPSLPWAMVFPWVDNCRATPRNSIRPASKASLLFVVLWLYSSRQAAARRGFRRLSDRLRLPALERRVFSFAGCGNLRFSYTVSMGQWLSLPMIVVGILFVVYAHRQRTLSRSVVGRATEEERNG
jgi:phosphatidylglycerol:prolipoprotein diacylglycerol transferase